jgi:hypothetical protein
MENITLTISDLATLRNIVDLASARGAFRAAELVEVGEVYNRLNQFVEASIAAAQANTTDQASTLPDNGQQSTTVKGN